MFLGIVAYTLLIPLCEALGSYLCQWFELQRSRLVVKQTWCKKEITDIEEGETEKTHHLSVIGFQTTSPSEDYEEGDDEEDE